MKRLVFFLACFLFFACSPIKRHQRLVERFPFVHTQDTITIVDTVSIQVPRVEHDTVFSTLSLHDTVYIEKENLKIRIHTIHDSIYIDAMCDTITVERVVERKIPIRYYKEKNKNPFWWIIFLLIALGVIVYLTKRQFFTK